MNPFHRSKIRVLGALALSLTLAACGNDDEPMNIVETAAANPELTSLVAALKFASNDNDLVNTLSGPGPFTVFAPTNAAFDSLARELTGNAAATGPDLLVPANKDLVRSVLQYHVVGANVRASDISLGKAVEPVLGGQSFFKIDTSNGKTGLYDGRARVAAITTTDILASNGVIHLLDKVALPADRTIVGIASSNAQFSSLVAALQFASDNNDLVNLLNGPGKFTVFAPTNAAFDALARELTNNSAATAADLLVPGNKDLVRSVLQYHVLDSRVLRAEVPLGKPIDPVLAGNATFTVNSNGGALAITDARTRVAPIAAADVFASNGVVHVLDRVILP